MSSRIKLCLGVLLVIIMVSGCRPPSPVQSPATKPEVRTPLVVAAESWKSFVSDARSRCEKEEGCTLDCEKLHEHDGRFYGVTVTGFKNSEYYVDLFRFDPESGKWIASPPGSPELGYQDVGIPATSKQWKVPEVTIRQWLGDADRTVKEIYSKRQ